MHRLTTFGGLRLSSDGSVASQPGGAPKPQRRSLSLLAILAATGGTISRERVVGILWPESDPQSARTALRQAIYAVRHELDADVIIADASNLHLNSDLISTDAQEFLLAMKQGGESRAVELYRGPFLDAVYSKNSGEFDNWIETQRSKFASAYRSALEKLAMRAAADADTYAAARWWQMLASEDPISSRVAAGLMEALSASGDSGAALDYYRVHEALVWKELGSRPDPSLEKIAQRIRLDPAAPTPPPATAVESNNRSILQEPVGGVSKKVSDKARSRVRTSYVVAGIATVIGAFFVLGRLGVAERFMQREANVARVAVAPFENRTGDARFDQLGAMTADWIIDGVSRAGFVNVVDPATSFLAAHDAREAGLKNVTGSKFAAAMSRGTAASAVVTGDYYLKGDSLEFHGRLTDVRTDRVLASMQVVVVPSTLPMLGVESVRQRVLAVLAREFDARLSDVVDSLSTPPAFDAYREYVAGLEDFIRDDYATAGPSFLHAYALDTTFAAALIWASHSYNNAGDLDSAKVVLEALVPMRERLVPLDRYALDALRAKYSGSLDSAIAAAKKAAALAPRSQWVWNVAFWSVGARRPRQAITFLESVDPSYGWWKGWVQYWIVLAQSKHAIGDYAGEARVIDVGLREHPKSLELLHVAKARNLIAQGRIPEVFEEVRQLLVSDKPELSTWISLTILELQLHGYGVEADSVFSMTIPWYESKGRATPQGRWGFGRMLFRAERWRELRTHFKSIAKENEGNPVVFGYVGSAAAVLGDTAEALAMADSLKGFVNGPAPVAAFSTFWRAQIAARLGHPAEAVALLREATATGFVGIGESLSHSPMARIPALKGYPPFEELMRSDR